MSTFNIFIDSKSRDLGTNTAPFYKFTNPEMRKAKTGFSVGLQEAILPNIGYNVNGFTNTIIMSENGANISFTMDEGNYDVFDFIQELETLLNANSLAGATYDVDFYAVTSKITITCVGATFAIIGNEGFLNVIGFTSSSSEVDVKTGDYPINLSGPAFVDVVCSLRTDNVNSAGNPQLFARIPLDVPYFNVKFYQNAVFDDIHVRDFTLQDVQVSLHTQYGTFYEIPDNFMWTLTFKVHFVNT